MTAEPSTPIKRPARHIPVSGGRLDWSVLVSIALMLAMALAVTFGDAGPATAYAAVPM